MFFLLFMFLLLLPLFTNLELYFVLLSVSVYPKDTKLRSVIQLIKPKLDKYVSFRPISWAKAPLPFDSCTPYISFAPSNPSLGFTLLFFITAAVVYTCLYNLSTLNNRLRCFVEKLLLSEQYYGLNVHSTPFALSLPNLTSVFASTVYILYSRNSSAAELMFCRHLT